MQRQKRLNLPNILYCYVQRYITSSNNNNLDTKSNYEMLMLRIFF